ncbi:OadG family protein [Hydrocarboniclastica marina]|nr:OadG family protein [Hydrocarboniclastica marina]
MHRTKVRHAKLLNVLINGKLCRLFAPASVYPTEAKIIFTQKGNDYMSELMSGALELTGVGMGFVFSFLIILVGVMVAMSAVLTRFAPEAPPAPAKRRQEPQARASAPAKVDADTAEAIRIAVSKYRARHK